MIASMPYIDRMLPRAVAVVMVPAAVICTAYSYRFWCTFIRPHRMHRTEAAYCYRCRTHRGLSVRLSVCLSVRLCVYVGHTRETSRNDCVDSKNGVYQ